MLRLSSGQPKIYSQKPFFGIFIFRIKSETANSSIYKKSKSYTHSTFIGHSKIFFSLCGKIRTAKSLREQPDFATWLSMGQKCLGGPWEVFFLFGVCNIHWRPLTSLPARQIVKIVRAKDCPAVCVRTSRARGL